MSDKRFTIEDSENQLIIYDDEGLDDYYHLGNDERDVKGICDLLNDFNEDNKQLKSLLKDAEDEIEALKKSNQKLMESLVEKDSEN